MTNKNVLRKLMGLMLSLVLVFGISAPAVLAHGDHDHHDIEYELEELDNISLADWNGEWKNMINFLELDECEEALEALTDAYEFEDKEAYLKNAINDSVPFYQIKVDADENTITYFEKADDEDMEHTFTYEYIGSVHFESGNHEGYWHVFETEVGEDEDDDFEILFLMEVHGEEVLAHFHMRLGHDIEECLHRESWWPTFVEADTPAEMINENYLSRAERHINTEIELEQLDDIALEDWDGNWNNLMAYLNEEELAEQVEELAEDFDMTVEDYIAEEQAESVPFERIEVDGEANKVRFYADKSSATEDAEDDGESVYTYEYEYIGSIKYEHGGSVAYWNIFEAKEEDALVPNLALMEVHGEESLAHFHIRCAKRLVNIAVDERYPTFVAEDTPLGMIAEELVEHAHAHGQDHDHDH